MKIPVYCPILIFFSVCVFGVTPPELELSYQRDELALRKLADNKQILNTFNAAYHRILDKSYPRKAFGLPFRELISFNTEYNINKISLEVQNELKKILMYFYASAPVTNDSTDTLANYHVTHIATWLNMHFETCTLFYGEEQQNITESCKEISQKGEITTAEGQDITESCKEISQEGEITTEKQNITESCKEISQFLKMFISVLSKARAYQYAHFKKESPKHIKAVERNFLNEEYAKTISKRLKDAIKVDSVTDPEIDDCNEIKNDDEKKYCNIWTEKIIAQPIDFKLDHIFFDVYNGHQENRYDVYSYDSYGSDYARSIELWQKLPELLGKAKEQQLKDVKEKNRITSYTAYALMQIMNFKISKFGANPLKLSASRPILDETEYYEKRYFEADEAETDDAQ